MSTGECRNMRIISSGYDIQPVFMHPCQVCCESHRIENLGLSGLKMELRVFRDRVGRLTPSSGMVEAETCESDFLRLTSV